MDVKGHSKSLNHSPVYLRTSFFWLHCKGWLYFVLLLCWLWFFHLVCFAQRKTAKTKSVLWNLLTKSNFMIACERRTNHGGRT